MYLISACCVPDIIVLVRGEHVTKMRQCFCLHSTCVLRGRHTVIGMMCVIPPVKVVHGIHDAGLGD